MLVNAKEHEFFKNLKALLHCHPANAIVVEKSEVVLIFDPLYVIYFLLPRSLQNLLFIFSVLKFHYDIHVLGP